MRPCWRARPTTSGDGPAEFSCPTPPAAQPSSQGKTQGTAASAWSRGTAQRERLCHLRTLHGSTARHRRQRGFPRDRCEAGSLPGDSPARAQGSGPHHQSLSRPLGPRPLSLPHPQSQLCGGSRFTSALLSRARRASDPCPWATMDLVFKLFIKPRLARAQLPGGTQGLRFRLYGGVAHRHPRERARD